MNGSRLRALGVVLAGLVLFVTVIGLHEAGIINVGEEIETSEFPTPIPTPVPLPTSTPFPHQEPVEIPFCIEDAFGNCDSNAVYRIIDCEAEVVLWIYEDSVLYGKGVGLAALPIKDTKLFYLEYCGD